MGPSARVGTLAGATAAVVSTTAMHKALASTLAVALLTAPVTSARAGTAALEPPPPPVPTPTTPVPTPTEPAPAIPDPTVPPPTATPGTPKRVYMPGTKGEEVVLPTPVDPTSREPTPVQPTGPKPVVGPTDTGNGTAVKVVPDDTPQPRSRDRRRRRDRAQAGTDDGATGVSSRCMAPLQRCRTLALTGIALSVSGAAVAAGGAALLAQPQTPLRDDPTMLKSFRPPGAVLLAVGSGLIITGIAVLAAGIVGHRRDESMRKRSAWWRPRMIVGVLP